MDKVASIKARLIESAIGAGLGAGIGGTAGAVKDKKHRFKGGLKGAAVGAGLGAVGAPIANKIVGVGVKKYRKKANNLADDIISKAKKDLSDIHYKGNGVYSELTDNDVTGALNKAKEEMIKFRKQQARKAGRQMQGKKTGMFSSSLDDELDDLTADYAYRTSNNPKGFARDMSEKYSPDKQTGKNYINSARSYLKDLRKENKDKKSIFRYVTKTSDLDEVKKAKDLFGQKRVVDAFEKKYVKEPEKFKGAVKNHKDTVFGNIKNSFKDAKDINTNKKKLNELNKNLQNYSHPDNKINNWNYKDSNLYNKLEVDKEFRKHYRAMKQEVKGQKEGEKAYNAAKEEMNKKFKKWDDRANMAGGGERSSSFTSKSSKDPHEILKNHGIDTGTIKTKAEVDKLKRTFAKKYHPDVNKAPDATARMQRAMADIDEVKNSNWYEKLAFYTEGIYKQAGIK